MNVEDALQMCSAPSLDFTGGEWCYAANTLAEALGAAEARCARLQQALEAIANDDTPAFRNEMGQWAERWERHEKVAREALAELDTPADRQPEEARDA